MEAGKLAVGLIECVCRLDDEVAGLCVELRRMVECVMCGSAEAATWT